MKLTLYSDLHLEFDANFFPDNPGSDVLILAGDICVANYFTRGEESPKRKAAAKFLDFFKHCNDNWQNVVYIAGNHESYQGRFDNTSSILKEALHDLSNVHYLDNESIELDGYLFLGTTLWTDLNKHNPITESIVRFAMNDYRVIQVKDGSIYRKLQPFDTIKAHEKAKNFIRDNAQLSDKVIVVGHHAPSPKSVHERYNNPDDYDINFAYHSNLEGLIESLPQIKCWVHGHVHNSFDYKVGSTRVVCNPRGYVDENKAFNPNLVIEV